MIGLFPAIIALLIGAAAAAVTIVAVNAGTSKPAKDPDVFFKVNDVTATRDAKGRPHIQVKYTLAVGDAIPSLFTPDARIQCYVTEPGGRRRAFIGESSLFVREGGTRDGSMVVTPAEHDSDIEGPVRVRCDATRAEHGYLAGAVTVDVPGPNSGPVAPAADPKQYEGVYETTFTVTDGIRSNCDPEVRHRRLTVKALSSSTISVELSGLGTEVLGISSFDTTLTKTAQFSGQMLLNPTEADTRGLLTGTFTGSTGEKTLQGRFITDDGHCTFDFSGRLAKTPDAGSLVISLEDIPGVDGCTPVLAASTVKAGRVTFSVTNNTTGFAQIFVYDAEHNLVGNNTKDIPPKGGGKVTFTSQLVTGRYDVQCDGPGGADKTVPLEVQ